jgi:hypothetical protein
MNDVLLQSLRHSVDGENVIKLLNDQGFTSIFDIVRLAPIAFCAQLAEFSDSQARDIHQAASQRVQALESLYRTYQSRREPVMQGIPKLGIAPFPKALEEAMQRSLGGAPDLDDLFPERSTDGYAEATSIQSLFSPGRYLVELYKVAQGLHLPDSPLNIDRRRPDIKALVLNQSNFMAEVSTLDVLLNVLQQGPDMVPMASLETKYFPMSLPYHDNLVQIRNALSAHQLTLQQVWDVLVDNQAGAFNSLTSAPSTPTPNQSPSPATREQLQLTPELYSLLVANPANAVTIQNHYGLPNTTDIPGQLKPVEVFTLRIGLSFNELLAMTAQADYTTQAVTTKGLYYQYQKTNSALVTEYGQRYLSNQSATPGALLVHTMQENLNKFELVLDATNYLTLTDRAERISRLYRHLNLEFHQLDWLIVNANQAVNANRALLLDTPVLSAVAEYSRLSNKYGIGCDEFCCFIGAMNTYALRYEKSFYQRLFTSPTDGTTIPLNATLDFKADSTSPYFLIMCNALRVSADELSFMAKLAFQNPDVVAMDPGKYGQLYRLAMIPRLLGLRFTEACVLWGMLNPSTDIAAIVAGAPTLQTLSIIRQSEAVLAWMATHELDVHTAFSMLTPVYNDALLPDLYNFTDNIYTSLASDPAAVMYQKNAPLPSPLQQKLYELIAPSFKSKPNVMDKLLQWQDLHFVSSLAPLKGDAQAYGLGDYWADVDIFHSNIDSREADSQEMLAVSANVARYSQGMAQYGLIGQWADLTEQDLTLIVSRPGWFMADVGWVGRPSFPLLLRIARLKQWLLRVVVPIPEALHYFAMANQSGQTAAQAIAYLVTVQGWDEITAQQNNDYLVNQGIYSGFPKCFDDVHRLQAWMQAATQLNVGSQCINSLFLMAKADAAAQASTLIGDVAKQLVTALKQ